VRRQWWDCLASVLVASNGAPQPCWLRAGQRTPSAPGKSHWVAGPNTRIGYTRSRIAGLPSLQEELCCGRSRSSHTALKWVPFRCGLAPPATPGLRQFLDDRTSAAYLEAYRLQTVRVFFEGAPVSVRLEALIVALNRRSTTPPVRSTRKGNTRLRSTSSSHRGSPLCIRRPASRGCRGGSRLM